MVSYPEHLPNFDYIGVYRYFLTFCTHERRHYFTEPDHVTLVRDQFLRRSTEDHFAVPAYCFMLDHVHLLVEGTQDDSDLRRFIKSAKQYSGFYFTQRTNAKLWQRYGFERVLRREEATVDVACYIVNNPIRAGLVDRLEDYAFWGSFTHSREELLEYIRKAA
jgi:REP-associated tyrosine transposase